MKMKLIVGVISGLLLAAGTAGAQMVDEVQLSVAGFKLDLNGAEKHAGVSWGSGPLELGKSWVAVFSLFDCGGFAATIPPNTFKDNATAGWRVEITALKVVNHAVSFRLRWVRALDPGTGFQPPNEDVEVTLRPGESRPIDTVPVVHAGKKTFDGRPCDTKAGSLRVLADFPELDRRLIGANVWLIERLPNGKEQSQLQTVRGLPHRPIHFYFDGVPDEAGRFDIFGKLVADPEQGGIEFTVETIRARADPTQQGYQASQWFKSTVHVKPNEIVDVALPPDVPALGKNAGAFAKRVFSIRIQAKQIR